MSNLPNIHGYPAITRHFEICERLMILREKDAEEKERLCGEMIRIIPNAKKEAEEYSKRKIDCMKKFHAETGEKHPDEYYQRYVLTIPTVNPFKILAIMYEKNGEYDKAIQICNEALTFPGYESDGTKGGMKGRLEKLMKKV